ncbi:MAG: hypothetical protein KGO02_19655 [Alphaproteobacteria bacterium]|nr:hypothetical protein [Alphaproteobacteria bacterium]
MFRQLISFAKNERANVAMIFAIAAVPLLYLVGMGVDYTTAADRQVQLNSAADAAALAAVTPSMMAQSTSASVTTAQSTFYAQADAISGVKTPQVSVAVSTEGTVRKVTVSYTAASQNFFPTLLGRSTIALGGSSQATAGLAPNIDFYLMLDDSPSMAIAATQSGINTMVSNTSAQGGCAFGCHESNPKADNLGNPNGEDNYTLARNLGVTLRIDLVREAAQNLMTTAQNTEASYNSAYRMGIYTFDVGLNTIQSLTSNLSSAQSAAGNIQQLEVYDNNCLTSSNCNSDEDTDFNKAMSQINSIMPDPGSGTGAPGDTPQEVLFIVTDGVIDAHVYSNPGYSQSYGTYCCSGRQQSTINPLNSGGSSVQTNWCTSVKNRGIRIAILYTEYLPLPTNSWYNSMISPFQSNIANQLQTCASPGLYYQVTTGGDISAAMASLFQMAVQSAYLSK